MHTSDYRTRLYRLSWLVVLTVIVLLTAGCPGNRQQEESVMGVFR